MTKNDLINIIASIKADFKKNKLAYLSITSKCEDILRNAIAFRMHDIHYKNPLGPYVCREWNRFDLGVIDINDNPEIIIECKSHNSLDFPGFLLDPRIQYPIVSDIKKLLDKAGSKTELYFIYFNNVLKLTSPIPPNCKSHNNNPIGYHHLLLSKNPCNLLPYKDKVLRVFKNWAFLLKQLNLPLGLTTAIEIDAGNYYGIPVSIIAFIYGPFLSDNIDVTNSIVCNLPVGKTFHDPKFWEKEPYKNDLERVKLDGIKFYYEDKALENLGNGIISEPI